jgi:hypothetical protein
MAGLFAAMIDQSSGAQQLLVPVSIEQVIVTIDTKHMTPADRLKNACMAARYQDAQFTDQDRNDLKDSKIRRLMLSNMKILAFACAPKKPN